MKTTPTKDESTDDPEYYLKLASELRRLGFRGIMDFAAAYPTASISQLAVRLGVAPILIHWKFIDEAIQQGQIRQYSKELLVRLLWCAPLGWRTDAASEGQSEILLHLAAWESDLHELKQDKIARFIIKHLLDSRAIPDGWQPADAGDPVLGAAFEKYWPETSC